MCGKCGALRVDRQLGLERTPQEYVANMVEVFREVRRILRSDGTCWINIGDSYAGGGGGNYGSGLNVKSHQSNPTSGDDKPSGVGGGIKPKDLIGIPWMVAFALRDDGWYLRSEIIWAKGLSFCETWSGTVMPESVTDRPTKAHEQVFLLAKRPNYFYDIDAARERAKWERWGTQTNEKHRDSGSTVSWIGTKSKEELQRRATPTWEERKAAGASRGNLAFGDNVGAGTQRGVHGEGVSHDLGDPAKGRNLRSVWAIMTKAYRDAHFAVFPQKLVEPIIKLGTSEKGCCPECNAPWERDVERIGGPQGDHTAVERDFDAPDFAVRATGRSRRAAGDTLKDRYREHGVPEFKMVGWRPTCECFGFLYRWRDDLEGDHVTYVWRNLEDEQRVTARLTPAVVMDIFLGSGTTAHVARKLGRHSVGIELNVEYAELIANRTRQLSLLT